MGSVWFRRCSYVVIFAITALLSLRQIQFVNRYALNIFYWDQWDLYVPIFEHRSWWALFTFQYGPHRQGVGFFITPILARISNCNTRWDAFAISCTMLIGCVLAMALCWRCGVRQPIAWLAVPLMYFSIGEYESFSGASNLSHGAMPVLLFTALCLAWFVQNHAMRILLISLLTFGLIFTGFGIFVGLLTPVVLLIETAQALRAGNRYHACLAALGLIAVAVSWGIFRIGYVFNPANPNFHFPYDRPSEYFWFVAMMHANFFGIDRHNPIAVTFGLVITLGMATMCLHHARLIIHKGVLNRRTSVVIFLFSAYSLVFCFNTAVGRVSFDWHTASLASRYVILMIPGGMAILLQLATIRRQFYAVALALVYAVCLMPGALQLGEEVTRWIDSAHQHRILWRDAFISTHDEFKADEISQYIVYSVPGGLKQRLNFIEQHHLNFFTDSASNRSDTPR